MKFEMANSDDPAEIVAAAQRSLVDSMRDVIKSLKADQEKLGKQPGLTWEQIDYFLLSYRDKTPKIIIQKAPV